MAILLITHDLGIVRNMADRCLRDEAGRNRRAGRDEDRCSPNLSTYTKDAAGRPNPRAIHLCRRAPVVMQTDNLKVWFPIKRGFFRSTVGHVKACNDVSSRCGPDRRLVL